MLSKNDKHVIELIQRSENIGDEWRKVSPILWKFMEDFQAKELLDIDKEQKLVRLSTAGQIVVKYLV